MFKPVHRTFFFPCPFFITQSNDQEHIVLETFDDDQWIENFRMKRETFASLCRDLEASLAPSNVVDVQKQESPSLASITNESVHVSPSDV
jgi:hypothetical protein